MSDFWRNWLTIWCVAVILFGATLLAGGIPATAGPVMMLLDQLNGAAPLEITPALYFANGVLGGVSVGWGVGTLGAIRVAIDLGDQGARLWRWTAAGVVTWFVTDSTLSVTTGFGFNVIPNTLFLITFFVPMLATGALKR
ncbi:MAG: hypothetical protein K2X73_06860 [Sphingomonas sp.]|jgi:hypothetical protein|uniref:hypothetical protein n=1 Tax=Sphingomonas sp. TaxID=28214 RepID=UPI0025E9A31A|nr:hypothetical protein [Sphingomonas sp.]MBX9881678.1 hypothetical protein [Sphingomonas sp.]